MCENANIRKVCLRTCLTQSQLQVVCVDREEQQLCSYATQTLDLSVNHITKRQKGISTSKNKNKMPSTIQMAVTWGACPVVGKQPGPNLMLVAIIGLEYRLERMSQGLDHSRGIHGASLPGGCWFFFFSFPFLFPFSLLCFNEPDLELASHRFIVLWPIW